jgi:hypothetical protein
MVDGGEWLASRPGRFTPRERAPGTHWIGGWVGSRAVLEAVVKRKIPSPRRPGTCRAGRSTSVANLQTFSPDRVSFVDLAIWINILQYVAADLSTRTCSVSSHFILSTRAQVCFSLISYGGNCDISWCKS